MIGADEVRFSGGQSILPTIVVDDIELREPFFGVLPGDVVADRGDILPPGTEPIPVDAALCADVMVHLRPADGRVLHDAETAVLEGDAIPNGPQMHVGVRCCPSEFEAAAISGGFEGVRSVAVIERPAILDQDDWLPRGSTIAARSR